MLKASHIIVADKILQDVQCQMNWRVNRTAYLFGSIAPDLNCIYPAHSITATIKRFRKKLNRVNKSESTIIKSFTLGVIMHYICDYFCYAHNRRMPDPKHSIYERLLKKHIKNHEEQLGEVPDSLINQWNEIKIHVTEEFSPDSNQDVDEIINQNVIVCIYDKKFSKSRKYSGLIGLDILERSEKRNELFTTIEKSPSCNSTGVISIL